MLDPYALARADTMSVGAFSTLICGESQPCFSSQNYCSFHIAKIPLDARLRCYSVQHPEALNFQHKCIVHRAKLSPQGNCFDWTPKNNVFGPEIY